MCPSICLAVKAVGGFAGPGDVDLGGDLDTGDIFHVTEDDVGNLQLSGTFERDDGSTLPVSTAVFSYLVDDDAGTFVQAQGDIDYSTGEFTVTIADIPLGFNNIILSFAVLDPADTPEDQGADTVFSLDVVNDGCGNPLTIVLEWSNTDVYFDFEITEPGGNIVYSGRTGVRVLACRRHCFAAWYVWSPGNTTCTVLSAMMFATPCIVKLSAGNETIGSDFQVQSCYHPLLSLS